MIAHWDHVVAYCDHASSLILTHVPPVFHSWDWMGLNVINTIQHWMGLNVINAIQHPPATLEDNALLLPPPKFHLGPSLPSLARMCTLYSSRIPSCSARNLVLQPPFVSEPSLDSPDQ